MKKYNVQPLDLMQFINTKYHEPFIHELLEFEGSDIVNITLHFFLKDVRSMLPPAAKHSIAAA